MTNSEKMRADRAKLVADAREILTAADEESRQLTAEERAKYDRIDDDIDGLGADIARTEKLEKVESAIMQPEERSSEAGQVQTIERRDDEMEYRQAFLGWARTGNNAEFRALTTATSSPFGGYTVPTNINDEIVKVLEDMSFMRQMATVIQVQGNQQIPVENTLGTAAWASAEGAAITADDVIFDKVTLNPYRLGALMTVSTALMDNNAFGDNGLESYLVGNFARRFAVAEEAAFVAGNGSGKPTKIVPDHDATGAIETAAVTTLTSDNLIDCFHSVGRAYRNASSGWIMHDSTGKIIRKLTEAVLGQYIWQPGLAAGTPDRLLGHPVFYSSEMDEFGTGVTTKVPVCFGDLSYYYISEHGPRQMQRLNERYADLGSVGFVMSHHMDGKLTNSAAIGSIQTA